MISWVPSTGIFTREKWEPEYEGLTLIHLTSSSDFHLTFPSTSDIPDSWVVCHSTSCQVPLLDSRWRAEGTGSYFKRRREIETRKALWWTLRDSFFSLQHRFPKAGISSWKLVFLFLVRVNHSKWKSFYNSIWLCKHSPLMSSNRVQMQTTHSSITRNNSQELKQTASLPTTLLPHKNSFHLEMSNRKRNKKGLLRCFKWL